MSIQTRIAGIGSLLLLLGLFGCSTLADLGIAVPYIGDPPLTAIEQLQEKPKGTLVYLRGTVSNYAPFFNWRSLSFAGWFRQDLDSHQ